jgi:hypothetical protein
MAGCTPIRRGTSLTASYPPAAATRRLQRFPFLRKAVVVLMLDYLTTHEDESWFDYLVRADKDDYYGGMDTDELLVQFGLERCR